MQALRLTGLGLRPQHYSEFINNKPKVAWLEVHSENYFFQGGKDLKILEEIRQHYPISLHGVSLSIGSTDGINWKHLQNLQELIKRIDPCLVSDHLCWSSLNGTYLHDLLPLPYTQEAVEMVSNNLQQVQEFLKRQVLIENISSYINFNDSEFSEAGFLVAVAKRSGCGILLDINNIYVNSINFNLNAEEFLKIIPAHLVQEYHLAGFSREIIHNKEVLIDTHNQKIAAPVWDLYTQTIALLGRKPTVIEWDADIPSFEVLYSEASQAETIMRDTYAITTVAI